MKILIRIACLALFLGTAGCFSSRLRRPPPSTPEISKLWAPDFKISAPSKKEEDELPSIYAVFAAARKNDQLLRVVYFQSPVQASVEVYEPHWMHGDSSFTLIKKDGIWKIVDWMYPL